MPCHNNVQPASRLRSYTAQRWMVRVILLVTISLATMEAALAQTSVLRSER